MSCCCPRLVCLGRAKRRGQPSGAVEAEYWWFATLSDGKIWISFLPLTRV